MFVCGTFPRGGKQIFVTFSQRPYPFTLIDLTCPLRCARPENGDFLQMACDI